MQFMPMSEITAPELTEESSIEAEPYVEEGDYHYDQRFLTRVVEGAILASGEALSIDKLLTLFDLERRPSRQLLLDTLETISNSQHDRGFVLKQVASGWRFEVCDDLAPWVNRLWEEKPQKYSRALLETLALIAYRQPLTRGDIEDVRGVAVSSHIIKSLSERDWIKVVGHRDVPGRPALYATTRQFLDYFGLRSLDQLPSLSELKDIDTLSESLALNDDIAVPDEVDDSPAYGELDRSGENELEAERDQLDLDLEEKRVGISAQQREPEESDFEEKELRQSDVEES
jgi:segregation and condensation protein B